MTLEQLRIFVAVAEQEHVTRAARDLNLTQSATSAAVAALEARYQTKLFDRIGRRIVLTDAGRLFLVEAKAVLARAASAETMLADLAGLKRGSLGIGASQTVGNYWLPAPLQLFRSRYPGIAIRLTMGNSETVAGLVHDGEADLGLIEGEIDDPSLSVTAVAEDEMVVVAAPDHPWLGNPPASVGAALNAKWVLREPGSGTRSILYAALAAENIDPKRLSISLELPSNEAVRAAVEAGAGVSVLSRLVAAGSLKAGTLAAVDMKLPMRRFFLLRHKERYVTRAQQAFMDLVVPKKAAGRPKRVDPSAAVH